LLVFDALKPAGSIGAGGSRFAIAGCLTFALRVEEYAFGINTDRFTKTEGVFAVIVYAAFWAGPNWKTSAEQTLFLAA
jgi:hypothetical protein